MSMSERERRALDDLAAQLISEDPRFARVLTTGLWSAPLYRHWLWAGTATASSIAAAVLVVTGVFMAQGVPEALGCAALTLSGMALGLLWMQPLSTPTTHTQPAPLASE